VGLFLGALMDRWIDVVMSAKQPRVEIYFDDRARYGICFGLLYFLFGAVAVDLVLQKFWPRAIELLGRKIPTLEVYNEVKLEQQRYAFLKSVERFIDELQFAQQALSKCTDGTLHLSCYYLWSPDDSTLDFCHRP
jgi:hypothetical protein